MKVKAISFYCLIVMVFFGIPLTQNSVNAQEKLTFGGIVGSDFLSQAGEAVLKEAYNEIGIRIEKRMLPAKRALLYSNSGRLDGELTRIKGINKIYPNLIFIPVNVANLEMCVFSKKVKFPVNGWNSLKPYKIGITRGIVILEKGTAGMQRDISDGNDEMFLKLDNNRTDIAIVNRVQGLMTIKKLKLSNIQTLWPPVVVIKLYHYLHEKNAELVPKITEILKRMEKQGRIEEINNRIIQQFLKK